MKIIMFVRHGYSESNARHMLSTEMNCNPLTSLGFAQAENIAREIGRLPKIDNVFTSPILRAVETAGVIAKGLSLAPKVDERLEERGFGSINNREFESEEAIEKFIIGEIKSDYPHGMESWESIGARVEDFMSGVPDGTVSVAVSHKGPIQAALDLMYGSNDAVSSFRVEIPFASITAIDFDGRRVIMKCSNSITQELLGILKDGAR